MNSSQESFSKEASVKNLRMSSYMATSQDNFNSTNPKGSANKSTGFQRSASKQRNKRNITQHGLQSADRVANQSRASLGDTNFNGVNKYPTINFKGDEDFAIKILDNMIQVEEDMQKGFSMYNRGKNLKKSLINPDRVKEYLAKVQKDKECKNFAKEQDKRDKMAAD